MRNVIFAAAFLIPSAALALDAVEVRARDHTCNELAQIIRQEKAVFVRIGIGGRSFRYQPEQCSLGDKRETTTLRDKNGALCLLDYSCEYDPQSFYNRVPSR